MSIHDQARYESLPYHDISSGESSPSDRSMLNLRQRSDDLMSLFPLPGRWFGTEIAGQGSDRGMSLGVNPGAPHAAGHGLHDEPHSPKRRASRSSGESISGLNSGQVDAFGITWPRAYINLSTVTKIKTEQTLKRREQNKQAQRSYRERKTKYAMELEAKVEEMDGCLQLLQLENRDLLRRLCDLRAKNNILRTSRAESEISNDSTVYGDTAKPEASKDNTASGDLTKSLTTSGSDACMPISKEELESLYEPYMAVWNLISSHLPPESQPEDFAVVLAYLQAMAMRRTQKSGQNEANEQD